MAKHYRPGSTLKVDTSKPMPRFNAKRRAKRESEGLVYGEHHEWIKRQHCELRSWDEDPICTYYPERLRVEGHHWHTVGSGGQDRDNQAPLCPRHHDFVHSLGSISAACDYFRRDFRSIACEYTARFDSEQGDDPEEVRVHG